MKEAQRAVNLYEKTLEETKEGAHAEMWATSPFYRDGHTRHSKVKIFGIVPDYATMVGDLTYLWLQEVRFFIGFVLFSVLNESIV